MKKKIPGIVRTFEFAFVAHTAVLVGVVAGATYGGASSLFAAYLAGALVSWFDDVSGIKGGNGTVASATAESASSSTPPENDASPPIPPSSAKLPTGELVYERYYKDPVNRILKPLFFVREPLSSLSVDEPQLTQSTHRPPSVSPFPLQKCSAELSSGAASSTRCSWLFRSSSRAYGYSKSEYPYSHCAPHSAISYHEWLQPSAPASPTERPRPSTPKNSSNHHDSSRSHRTTRHQPRHNPNNPRLHRQNPSPSTRPPSSSSACSPAAK